MLFPFVFLFSLGEISLRLFTKTDEKVWLKNKSNESTPRRYCLFGESIKLDPFLAYVLDKDSPCNVGIRINNVNLQGDDFPLIKQPNDYVVLLIGGSVAQLLGNGFKEDLFSFFTQKYKNKNVKFLVGALRGWSYPQQFNLFARFAPIVDTVISVDGFNETLQIMDSFNPFGSFSLPFMMQERNQKSLNFLFSTKWYYYLEDLKEQNSCGFSFLCHFVLERTQSLILKYYVFDEGRIKKDFERSIAYDGIDPKEARRLNLEQYLNYLRMTDYIAKGYNIDTYHFLQPVPALQKKLTSEEMSLVNSSSEFSMDSYRGMYTQVEKAFLSLKKEKMKVYSLVSIFDRITETVYIDHIRPNKLGNKIMSKAIIEKLKE